jgi:hypothetical protein
MIRKNPLPGLDAIRFSDKTMRKEMPDRTR